MIPISKKLEKLNFIFLLLILCTIIFRSICTILIIGYIFFQIFSFIKLKYKIKILRLTVILSIPFLIEVLTFWNNDYVYYGIKSLEQKIVYLFFPIFIFASPLKINVFKLINYWIKMTLLVLIIFFIRYLILFSDNVTKYINGIDVWDMGYSFSRNMVNNHAPALNMIISFVTVCSLYVFFKQMQKGKKWNNVFNFIVYIMLFIFVLFINTRIAVVCMVLGSFFIAIYEYRNFLTLKRVILGGGVISILIFAFLYFFPYTIEKYTTVSFKNMDKIGRLDEVENPESEVYNSLVSRLSMWKSTFNLSKRNIWLGVGASDGKRKLFEYYYETDQMFLFKYKLPVHNQYLDYLLRFGIVGTVMLVVFLLVPLYIGIKLKNSIIIYYSVAFIISNLTDDFLIRFDGIVFSCMMVCLSGYCYLYNQDRYLLVK